MMSFGVEWDIELCLHEGIMYHKAELYIPSETIQVSVSHV